jgi:excisionase family DNA binding protein
MDDTKMNHKLSLNELSFMSTYDVAKEMGVTIRAVQLWMDQGLLKGWKTPGGHRRITAESFNSFVLAQGGNLSQIKIEVPHLKIVPLKGKEDTRNNENFSVTVEKLNAEVLQLKNAHERMIKILGVLMEV